MSVQPVLEQLIHPFGDCLTPEVARRIAALRAPLELQEKMEEFADRSSEGLLTDAEAEEYRALVSAGTIFALLQAEAREVASR
ncbi:MAG: hypothetical protein R3F11_06800 [Verrucomicrobiales bacterium]